jgi:hypothetical protein
MQSMTRKLLSLNTVLGTDELCIYEYAVRALALDSERVYIDGEYYIIMSKTHVTKNWPDLDIIQGIRFVHAVGALVTKGLLKKKIHAEVAYYSAGPLMLEAEGFSFLRPVTPTKTQKELKANNKLTLEQRKQIFTDQALIAARKWNDQPVKDYTLTKADVDDFINYWTATLQKNPQKMKYEDEKTFVFDQRLRTGIQRVYMQKPKHPQAPANGAVSPIKMNA